MDNGFLKGPLTTRGGWWGSFRQNPGDLGCPPGVGARPYPVSAFHNDIGEDISSHIRLFADDMIIYRAVNGREDPKHL